MKDKIEQILNQYEASQFLSIEEKREIACSLELGILLSLGKLLEESLGMKGLISSCVGSKINNPQNLAESAVESFKEQGFDDEEASYLAEVSGRLKIATTIQPKIEGEVSVEWIDMWSIINAIKTALILNHHSLEKADLIAQACVKKVFEEKHIISSQTFYDELEVTLKDFKITYASKITKTVPFVFKLLTLDERMNSYQIGRMIEERVIQITSPVVGLPNAKSLAKNIRDIWDCTDRNHLGFKERVTLLKGEIGDKWATEVQQMLDMTEAPLVSSLLIKLSEPAKLFLRIEGKSSIERAGPNSAMDVPILI